ncbi:chemotaxis regulatory protein CheY [Roseimaritima multifibrata]|uniref:Chemotaxis regulatory protein CheY n=1 Tax=Roseimaritima multifibrata TaxID=1930274 RepID=A0A517MPB8_9BACT|nr:response regulator [Roseimaritima multifibrata]QDS96714.1 chemotaxis regulatory protein CheY [Roseimaritima multifibrata]
MTKTVVDCGNCSPDFNSISSMLKSSYSVQVLQTNGAEDTLKVLRSQRVDLVTVNRKLDQDYSDGIEVIRQIKADSEIASIPVMLVTNHAEHQEAAIAEGAIYGFGKLALQAPETHQRLKEVLG